MFIGLHRWTDVTFPLFDLGPPNMSLVVIGGVRLFCTLEFLLYERWEAHSPTVPNNTTTDKKFSPTHDLMRNDFWNVHMSWCSVLRWSGQSVNQRPYIDMKKYHKYAILFEDSDNHNILLIQATCQLMFLLIVKEPLRVTLEQQMDHPMVQWDVCYDLIWATVYLVIPLYRI